MHWFSHFDAITMSLLVNVHEFFVGIDVQCQKFPVRRIPHIQVSLKNLHYFARGSLNPVFFSASVLPVLWLLIPVEKNIQSITFTWTCVNPTVSWATALTHEHFSNNNYASSRFLLQKSLVCHPFKEPYTIEVKYLFYQNCLFRV